MAETTTAERSARYREGLARQLREIQRELATLREELGSRLPVLTKRLAEDSRLTERKQ
jgi:hypothetical protein